MTKKICIDIDGILTKETEGFGKKYYPKRTPNTYNIKTLQDYKKRGFQIILYSARYREDIDMTTKWLDKNQVPYDNVILGKPQAEVYVDDRAVNQLDREVLLFSGGVDSLIAWHWFDKPKPIYVMLYHRYQKKEIECIKALEKMIPSLNVEFVQGPVLGKFEIGDKAYISQRNLQLALCAVHQGNLIYMAGVKGDKVEDKTPEAFSVMSFAMNFIKKPSELEIKIKSPFWEMTKTEIIKWFLENYPQDYVENVLRTSVSCYDANIDGSCGACPACFRKWISLEAAGIESWNWFTKDIREWKGIKGYITRIKKGEYDIQRSQETKAVLKKYNIW